MVDANNSPNNIPKDPYAGYTVEYLLKKVMEIIAEESIRVQGNWKHLDRAGWCTDRILFAFNEQYCFSEKDDEWKLVGPSFDEQSSSLYKRLKEVERRLPPDVKFLIGSAEGFQWLKFDRDFPMKVRQKSYYYECDIYPNPEFMKMRFSSLCEGNFIHDYRAKAEFRREARNSYNRLKIEKLSAIREIVDRLPLSIEDDVWRLSSYGCKLYCPEGGWINLEQFGFSEWLEEADEYALMQLLVEEISKIDGGKYYYQIDECQNIKRVKKLSNTNNEGE